MQHYRSYRERFRERASFDRARLEEERAQKEKDEEPLRLASAFYGCWAMYRCKFI
jgi:hypothetical protein